MRICRKFSTLQNSDWMKFHHVLHGFVYRTSETNRSVTNYNTVITVGIIAFLKVDEIKLCPYTVVHSVQKNQVLRIFKSSPGSDISIQPAL